MAEEAQSDFEYYVFPDDVDPEELEPEEAEQYRIAQPPKSTTALLDQEMCYPAEQTRKKCRCGRRRVVRWASGTVYRTASGERCYARYESCYVVCARDRETDTADTD